ncbi:hypothetical protein BY996DRAFT_4229232 [Phakopsora pachyrhizi]|nr:hypothetical protein BY996DRAFT_4229232 [Phakopsora pachyrhizi]
MLAFSFFEVLKITEICCLEWGLGFFLKEEEEKVMYQSSIEISNQVSTTSEVTDQSSTIVEKNSLEDLNRTLLESNSDSENISLKLENVAIPSCCSMDKRSETGSSYDKSILRSSSALIGSLGTITSEEKFDLEREKVLLRKASDVSQSNLENPFNSALEDSPTSSVTACSTPRSIEDHLSESKGVDGLRQEDHPRVDGILERRVKSHSLSAQRELRVKIPKPFSSYRTSSAGVLENCALSSTRNSNLDSITDEIDELLAEIEREEKNFSRAVLIESKKVSTSSVKEEDFEDPSCLSENLNDEEGSRKISNQQKLETEDFKDLVEPSPQQIETRVGLSSLSCLEPERAHLNFKGSRLSRLGSISEDGSSEQSPLEKKRRQSSFYMAQPRASLSSSTNLQLVEENFEDGEEPMVESFFFQGLDSSKRPEFNKTCSTPESISPTFSEKDSSKVSDEQSGEATSRFEEDNNSHETIERKDEIIDGAKDQVIRPVEFVKTVKGSFVESGEQSIEEEVSLVLKNESVRQGEGDDLDSRREGSPMLTEDKAEELREEELVMMIEDERNPEVEVKVLKPRFEYALLRFPTTILSRVLREMDYLEFHNLPQISKKLRLGLDSGEAREVVMERFLGAVGYRTITPDQSYRQQQDASWFRGKQRMMSAFDSSTVIYRQSVPGGSSSSNSTINRDHNFNCIRSSTSVMSLRRPVQSPIPITLRDLHAYYTGLEFSDQELSELAESLPKDGVEMSTFRMIRSSTRAYNKILVRVRSQPMESSDDSDQRGDVAETYHLGRRVMPIYRAEKPVILKVWVPSIEGVMSSKELVECEKELWKSEIRGFLRTGDVCWNTAIGSRENLGKVIYDGQVLRELQQLWDPTGHLPNWLNMLKFSPSFYHNVIKSSNSTPVFYLDLTDFKDQVQETLNLCQDKFEISNNKFSRRNSRFRVQRWVYRATIRIKPGMRTGLLMRGVEEELNTGDFRGSGDERGSMIDREWIHRDWTGEILIQVEGSAEKARDLLDRCEKSRIEDFVGEYEMTGFRFWNKEKRLKVLSNMKESQLSPWKIIRERSSLGRIWVQALYNISNNSDSLI